MAWPFTKRQKQGKDGERGRGERANRDRARAAAQRSGRRRSKKADENERAIAAQRTPTYRCKKCGTRYRDGSSCDCGKRSEPLFRRDEGRDATGNLKPRGGRNGR